MDATQLNAISLTLCMHSGFRYLEVLNDMAKHYKNELDPVVYEDITQAFVEYKRRMLEAGMEILLDREHG